MTTIRISLARNANHVAGWRRPSDVGGRTEIDRQDAKAIRLSKRRKTNYTREKTTDFRPPEGCVYEIRRSGSVWEAWRKTWRGDKLPVVKLVAVGETEQEVEAVVMRAIQG